MSVLSIIGLVFGSIFGLLATIILILVIIGKVKPRLFMYVPNVGWLMWIIIGGGDMPPYFVWDMYKDDEFRYWAPDGTVIAAVGAKSGTTWICNICHMLRSRGDPNNHFKYNTETTPWPECLWHPDQTYEMLKEQTSKFDGMTNPEYPFRVFKAHGLPRADGVSYEEGKKSKEVVPVRQYPGVKYIVCARAGPDVLCSFFPFFGMHADWWRELWGGAPAAFQTFDDAFDFVVKDFPDFYFGFVKAWWPFRQDENVLMLHYTDLKTDLPKQLRKIASHIDVGDDFTAAEWALVEEKCSFAWMQANEEKFQYHCPGSFETYGEERWLMKTEKGSFVRKGAIGEGKEKMTEAQMQKFMEVEAEYFENDAKLIRWAREGGAFGDGRNTIARLKAGGMGTKQRPTTTTYNYARFDTPLSPKSKEFRDPFANDEAKVPLLESA